MKRSIIYVDGFNLYYGLLRSGKYRRCKWLDLDRLFRRVRPDDEIIAIKYFTAYWPDDSGRRHSLYTTALAQSPVISVIEGRYKRKGFTCRVRECDFPGSRHYQWFEEKQTDVNIALHMLDDSYEIRPEVVVLVSADSDLVPAISLLQRRLSGSRIVVYIPGPRSRYDTATELRTVADEVKLLPAALLPHCQLPARVSIGGGALVEKPAAW